jgi:rare lipoprotein A (peptidoglycan hydrolase)
LSECKIYCLKSYFNNRFRNRIFSFLFSIISILFISILAKAEEIPENLQGEDISIYQPDLFEETEELNVGSDFVFEQSGIASWYGKNFNKRKTASGERFNMFSLSAAHRQLPFNSIIRVTNLETNEKILVRINDRGPFVKNKIIDLSYQVMKEINTCGSSEIKLEGLIVNEQNIIGLKPNLLFCYSLTLPLVCLPDSVLNVMDSSEDFDDAYNKYIEVALKNPDKRIYLTVYSHENRFNTSQNTTNQYFISEFISKDEIIPNPELTAK